MSYIVRPKFLSGFEVEWVISYGDQDPDDFNPDLLKYAKRDFEQKAEAVAFAKKITATAIDGEARLTAFDLEEYEAGTRVYFKRYGATDYFDEPSRS